MNTYQEYIAEDFEQMTYNVHALDFGVSPSTKWEFFRSFKEFKVRTELPKQKIFKYIVYAFDPYSPVNKLTDVAHRRVDAALLAGFIPNKKGVFQDKEDKLLKSLYPEINAMIIRYCMFAGGSDYSILKTYETSLGDELKSLIEIDDDTGTKKKNIIANINTLRSEIDTLKESFFVHNIDVLLKKSFHEFKESESIDLGPEKMAKVMQSWNNISRHYEESNWDTLDKKSIK